MGGLYSRVGSSESSELINALRRKKVFTIGASPSKYSIPHQSDALPSKM